MNRPGRWAGGARGPVTVSAALLTASVATLLIGVNTAGTAWLITTCVIAVAALVPVVTGIVRGNRVRAAAGADTDHDHDD